MSETVWAKTTGGTTTVFRTTELLENFAAYHPTMLPCDFPVYGQLVQIPKEVIFNPPATIVIWSDGSKTVVKCMEGDEYSKDVGLAMCFCKRMLGSGYKRMFKKWCREET